MHNDASRANRLRAPTSVRTAVFYGATLDSRSAAALAHRRPAVLAGRPSAAPARLLYATLAGGQPCYAARLADARKRHADGKYGTIPLVIFELGNRSQWATEHPSSPVSPRLVRNEGGVDDEVDGGARVSGNNGTKQRGVIKVDGGVDRSQARVQRSTAAADSSCADVNSRRRSPLRSGGGLSATTHVTAGGIAPTYGYFKFSPDRITVAPLQGRQDLITWRESIEPHLEVVGLRRRHCANSARGRCRAARGVSCGSLAHLHGHLVVLLAGGAAGAQELSRATGCWLPSMALHPVDVPRQRGKPGGGGSGGGRLTKDVDEKRSTRDKGRGGGGRRRECWICHNPDHLSYECPDRDDSDEDDTKGGRVRSTSRRPRRDAKSRKEKQTSKKTSSTKDVDNSSGKSRGDGEASCSMVGVVEPTVSLAPKAGEDFQAVAAAVQANPMAVLLDSGCSHHPMGMKTVFVDMAPSDDVKQVRGFNGALQPVKGRGTVAMQGEVGKRVLIPDVAGDDSVPAADREEARPHIGACVGLHGAGWEVLDLIDNKVVTSVEVIFYETLSLEVWKAKFGPASGRTQAHPPTNTSTATVPLLAEVDEPSDEDVVEVLPPPLALAPPFPIADRPASTPVSAIGDEGSLEASPVAPASGIASGQQGAKLVNQDGKPSTTGEQQTGEPVEQEAAAGVQLTGEQQTGQLTGELSKSARGEQLVEGLKQLVDDLAVDEEGELSAVEVSTDSDEFVTWLDDLQLYLLSDSMDSVLLFDHTSGAAPAPPATADRVTRSQWLTRDTAARLAIRNHLPLAECAHFGQHRIAQAPYDAVVARYSLPATAALGRLLLPYLFPELSAFATVEDMVSHLRTSDARYRAALPAEFLVKNPPPMYITLYFIVTRLPDSLRAVRDHFLALDPTDLTLDLLEQHLLAAETSAVTVGATRGTPCTPIFEGWPPSPFAPSYASAATADVPGAEDARAASASAKRRSSKGKGGRGGGGGTSGGGRGSFGGDGGGNGGSGGSGSRGSGGGRTGAQRGGSKGGQSFSCPYVIRTGGRAGQTCGKLHTQHRCFSRLDDAWRAEFGDEAERPRWAELLRSGVAIFDLDDDAILAAMYALSVSAEGDCYLCVLPDPGIEAAALGASKSVLLVTAPDEALHTFTLDSGASRCFFRDSTTLTPLSAPVPVSLADPSQGPVLACSSTVLSCPVVPSDSLLGLHLPLFSMNLVSIAALQDAMVTNTTPRGHRVSICTCTRTGRHLATFTSRPGSSLYTLAIEPPQVAASAQVSASGLVAPPCSCRLLSHQTLLWHHCLGHPSLPRLRGMHSRLLVSSLPRPLPPLPPSPAPPCLPCIEGRQRAAPHSSSFPPTTAPLLTLHMDVWDPARVSGHGRERYFLLDVDDHTRYTTVFPFRSKGQVVDVLIPWIRAVRLLLRERFSTDLLVLRLHSVRGGEFSYDLLRDFYRWEGILQTFTLSDSPQQSGIAERRIGLVMEVARTSMIHAAAPHFLWPFAVRYVAHQLKLWPRVSLPETSPILRWTGKVGDASVFRVWGSRAFVRDTYADKLSAQAFPCVFLGFVPDAPGWQFYHPTLRRVFPSQDVTFDELVPFYRLFPYRSAPPPPPSLFLAPGPPLVETLPPQGPAPSGVSQVDPRPGTAPVEPGGADSEGAGSGGVGFEGAGSRGAEPGGAEPGGAEPEGVEPWGAEPEGVEPGSAEFEGAESGDAESRGTASSGGPAGASPCLSPQPEPPSPQQLREWFAQRTRLRRGATGAEVSTARETGAGGAGITAGAGGTGGAAAAGPGCACTGGTGASGSGGIRGAGAGDPTERGAAGAGGVGAVGAAGGAGGTVRQRPYFVPLLQQVLASPLPAPSPYTEQSGGLTERREPASRPASPVRTGHRVPRLLPPPVPGTHVMALRPSSVPQRVPLPPPPESSLLAVPDPESDHAHAASPTVSRLLSTVVTDPSFESTAASALIAELVDFAAACRIDYATALVAESESASPPSVGGECALGTDVLEDRQEDLECLAAALPRLTSMMLAPEGDPDAPDILTPRSYAEAITGPYSSQWQTAMDAEMAFWMSTSTYIDAVPLSRANIVDGMWIFRVKRPPGSSPAFKARYVARGFSQRQGVDYFQTFSPTPKMTTLRLPSSPPVHSESPTAYGPTFLPPGSTPATSLCPPRARPSSPLADLHTVLFRSSPRCSSLVSVLPLTPESSLIVSSHPITDYHRAACPVVSCVLASLVTDPRASPSSVSAPTAAIADFASTHRLDYATRVVAAPLPRPLSVGGDPNALDIPTPRTYREAVSREWASQWKAAIVRI
ncbi:unnamed protein product [Closterium sp. NIES-54]